MRAFPENDRLFTSEPYGPPCSCEELVFVKRNQRHTQMNSVVDRVSPVCTGVSYVPLAGKHSQRPVDLSKKLFVRAGKNSKLNFCGRKRPVWYPVFGPKIPPEKVYVGPFFAFFPRK